MAHTSYSKVYQDATSVPSEVTAATYDIANPLPAGTIESFGIRLTGTSAGQMSETTTSELISAMRVSFNGDTWLNWNSQVAVNTSTGASRIGAMLDDIGGFVAENLSATAVDMTLWFPCGINLPSNSRFELQLSYAVAANPISTPKFEVWLKYGEASNATIIGNSTSETLAADSQTQITVKIPTYANAKVSGIVIQGPSAADNLTTVIVKSLGLYEMTPSFLRGVSGASQNGYQWADAGASAAANQYSNNLAGYYFVPTYGLTQTDGSVVLLVTASVAETYTFTPILSLPTGGSSESEPTQTQSAKTGSAESILKRAED